MIQDSVAFLMVSLVLGTCLPITMAHAQTDAKAGVAATVWIEPRSGNEDRSGLSPRDIVRSELWVEKFDDQSLTFRKSDADKSSSVVEGRVVWIEPKGLSEEATQAIAALYERKAAVDIASLLNELKQPHPAWLSQWVGMHLWQATYLGEKNAATLELVNQLDVQPMPSLIVGGLPIRWTDQKPSAIALAAAKASLQDRREATQLTAASWLLDSADDVQAREVLSRLASGSKRKPIRAVAGFLLEIPLGAKSSKQLSPQTLKALDQLPLTLSAGPTQRMVAWYREQGQQDRSLEMSLRSILIAPRPNPLSSLPPESEELWKELSAEINGRR